MIDLSKLNDEQKKAVLTTKGPLLILAGAGSGKTRVLTTRIAWLIEEEGVNPLNILALTFTNKAASEMRERVDRIVEYGAEHIWVSTFHSTCVKILRRWIDRIGYERNFTIYDSDDSKALMKDVCKYLDIDTKQIKERAILSVISHAKNEMIGVDEFEKNAGGDRMQKIFASCYREYQKRLKLANGLDFDDLLLKTVELFDLDSDALAYYRRRFRYILVDEYQDTNSVQFKMLEYLAENTDDEGRPVHNLCVVGDDDQSIYKFRGANIRNILDFEKCYPEATVIRLEQNYRSTKSILDCANEVIRNNCGRKEKRLWTENETGESVHYTCFDSEKDEAGAIADDVVGAVRNGDRFYRDFAVLYRTNAQSRIIEESLIRANIPYRIIGSVNFYQRKEVKDILAYLRLINNPADSASAKRIINAPRRGIGATTIERIDEYAAQNDMSFYEALCHAEFIPSLKRSVEKLMRFSALIETLSSKVGRGEISVKELIEEIIEQTGYVSRLYVDEDEEKAGEREENVKELLSKAESYAEEMEELQEESNLSGFLENVSLVGDIDSYDEESDVVVLMTLHMAKGLEFPYVYIVGMEEGIFPSYMSLNSDTPYEEIEEERRLCYVGMTRAKKELSLSACRERLMHGEYQNNQPSRFIKEIPRHLLNVRTGSGLSFSGRRGLRDEYAGGSGNGGEYARRRGFSDEYAGGSGNSGEYARRRNFSDEYAGGSGNGGEYYKRKTSAGTDFSKLFANSVMRGKDLKEAIKGGLDYEVGDTVKHIKFGIGKVLEIEKTEDDYSVSVEFPAGVRKMKASFAKLSKVGP